MLKVLTTSFSRIYKLLPRGLRSKAGLVLLSLLLNSMLDLLGLAALIPLIILVIDQNAIENNELLRLLYDLLGFDNYDSFILVICLSILIVVITKNVIAVVLYRVQSNFTYKLNRYFSTKLFLKLNHWGLLRFKQKNSGYFFRNIHGIPADFSANVLLQSLNLLLELVVLVFIVVGLLFYSPQVLLLVFLVVAPTFTILYVSTKRKIKEIAEDMDTLKPQILQLLFESINGYIDVKVNRKLEVYFKRYDEFMKTLANLQSLSFVFKQLPTKVIETSMILGVLTIIGFGVIYFEQRSQLITLLSVFALAAYRILPSVNRMMLSVISIKGYQYSLDALERVYEKHEEEDQLKTQLSFNEKISLENIVFKYPKMTGNALNNLSLDISKGETLGIIGRSGSGKSTLINILLLLLKPDSGSISLDSQELGVKLQHSWHGMIGYVPQDVFILDSTIAENIAFGETISEIDFKRVEEVANVAGLKHLIGCLPNGLNTRIGERGSSLSGGQRQRVGIARALYSGARVLLFDEATSALDSETEKEVTEAINELSNSDYTMIIVAHRITTLKYCDRILSLAEGRVEKEVSYDELLRETLELGD